MVLLNYKKNIVVLLFLVLCCSSFAQYTYKTAFETILGKGENTPFWLMNMRNGISSKDMNNSSLQFKIQKEFDSLRIIDYRFGLDLYALNNYPSKFLLQQVYVDIKYKTLEFSMGSKEYKSELKNQLLTSGGMVWSGNARPIPMIRLSIPEFTSFNWLFHNQLKVKAALAYGWYTDGDYQARSFKCTREDESMWFFYNKNILYHQKELFLLYNLPKTPWSFTFGVEYITQFSGDKYYIKDQKLQVEHSKHSLKEYLMALLPLPGGNDSPIGDQQYVFGNTLGSEHLVVNYDRNKFSIKAYLENYFEDFGGLIKQNGWDGLWGLEVNWKRTKGITSLLFEYLQTTDQSGPQLWDPGDFPGTALQYWASGNDDYYNNFYYTGGKHWGMTTGNPLITSPIYNTDGFVRINNNRVKAYHIGVSGALSDAISGRVLTTYSDNWGRHYYPFFKVKSNVSLLFELNITHKSIKGWTISSAFGLDSGDLYGNNSALSLKISKKGNLFN